jgi:Ca2+-binding RTX toxin-like protein
VAGLPAGVSVLHSESANDSVLVKGLEGDDTLDASKLAGNLVKLTLDGGDGEDTLLGSKGPDTLLGGNGNDLLLGKGGDDQVSGEAGEDRMVWNPADGSDINEGGDGSDSVEVNGPDINEVYSVVANAGRVRLERSVPTSAPFSIDIGTSENLVVNMNGGNDEFSAGNGLAALIKITVDGGEGRDVMNGGDGADVFLGGPGKDTIDGNRGNDVAFMGDGDDLFIWDPGDGSDVVEGQDGTDKLLFNGANAAERIDVSANGGRVRFFRDLANINMDLDDTEIVEFNALGGADTMTVNDLSGTDTNSVVLELASTLGGFDGDGAIDTVVVNGTNADDNITVERAGGNVVVSGLPATVTIGASEATDRLEVNGLGGNDTLNANGLPAGEITLNFVQ